MMLDATRHYDKPLTSEGLFAWHASFFPTGRSGMRRIRVGAWRDDTGGPMEVVSGAMGKERIHFEAPAAKKLDPEMGAFLDWFDGNTEGDWVVKAGMAHLWFVTIHYDIPERTQKATMDITPWMDWLLGCLGRAIEGAQATLGTVLSKAHFWETFGDSLLNDSGLLLTDCSMASTGNSLP
jgi:Fic family protein